MNRIIARLNKKANLTEEQEKFINNEIKFDDIEKAQKMLKVGFFKKLKELYR